MVWSVNDIFELTKLLTRKNQSGSISASNLFYAWNTEQNAYHSDIVGKWQARNNGKTGTNTGLVLDEITLTKLAPFTIPVSIAVSGGKAMKPTDFIYGLARRMLVDGVEYLATLINAGQKYYVNNDVIDPPSITDNTYYILQYEDYYEILPSNSTGELQLDYVAAPEDIKWGYTFDSKKRQVYNEGTSVQPKWNSATIQEITKRTLTTFGVSFKDKDFEQFGEKNTITGDS